jgi:4a-hydroxytetrahydrobiopterin dehydratase
VLEMPCSELVTRCWDERDDGLYRQFTFPNFAEAWTFMTAVAELAEAQDHHPDWSNSFNVVDIRLCSHDVGHIVTARDHRLAKSINAVMGEPDE